MSLNKLEEVRLTSFKEKLGELTVDDALTAAIEAEEWANQLGPFDQGFEFFIRQRNRYLEYAALLEKEAT